MAMCSVSAMDLHSKFVHVHVHTAIISVSTGSFKSSLNARYKSTSRGWGVHTLMPIKKVNSNVHCSIHIST